MDYKKFFDLVDEYNGFELVIGYTDDVDHYIGGIGNKYWYEVVKGNKVEYYLGTYHDGIWEDKFYKAKGNKIISSKTVEPGTTIKKIIDKAYLCQDMIENKKPIRIEKENDTYLHYVKGFGDKAWEISEKYGVTTLYSDINNVEEGYHLRDILTGKEVDKPNEN